MIRTRVAMVGALIAGGALGVGLDRAVLAQQSGITRTILQRFEASPRR